MIFFEFKWFDYLLYRRIGRYRYPYPSIAFINYYRWMNEHLLICWYIYIYVYYIYLHSNNKKLEILEKAEIIRVRNIVTIARYRHGKIQIILRN